MDVDNNVKHSWNKGQRICSVLIRSASVLHNGEVLRFMTLTTANDMKLSLNRSFNGLVTEIKRLSVLRLLEDGYIDGSKLEYFYGDKFLDDFMVFKYLAVFTSEGIAGVVHVLYYGDYIPKEWLSDVWLRITGSAFIVDVRSVGDGYFKDTEVLSNYVVNQYVSGQSKFVRYSCSRDFGFVGFSSRWRFHKRLYDMSDCEKREKCYRDWNRLLKRYVKLGKIALYRPAKIDGKIVKIDDWC